MRRRSPVAAIAVLAAGAACGSPRSEAEVPPPSGSLMETGSRELKRPAPPPPPPQPTVTSAPTEQSKAPVEPPLVTSVALEIDLRPRREGADTGKKGKNRMDDPKRTTPHAVIGEDADGRIPEEDVRSAITKGQESFRPCLTQDVTIRLVASVLPSGAVGEAKSERSSPDDPRVRDCIVTAFMKLRFPTGWAKDGTAPARIAVDLSLRKNAD
jgi:hypothetical protein